MIPTEDMLKEAIQKREENKLRGTMDIIKDVMQMTVTEEKYNEISDLYYNARIIGTFLISVILMLL